MRSSSSSSSSSQTHLFSTLSDGEMDNYAWVILLACFETEKCPEKCKISQKKKYSRERFLTWEREKLRKPSSEHHWLVWWGLKGVNRCRKLRSRLSFGVPRTLCLFLCPGLTVSSTPFLTKLSVLYLSRFKRHHAGNCVKWWLHPNQGKEKEQSGNHERGAPFLITLTRMGSQKV